MNENLPDSTSGGYAVPPQPPYQGLQPTLLNMQHLQATLQTGPLPPARELAAYEQAHPGAAAWILSEAQINAAHVRQMEVVGAKLQSRDAFLFRVLPFIAVFAFLMCTMMIAIFANAWAGSALLASGLVTIVLAYIRGVLPSDKTSDGTVVSGQ